MTLDDIDPSPWASWVGIAVGFLTILGFFGTLVTLLIIWQVRKQIRIEFGGNGGGIREAVNRLEVGQTTQDARLDAHLNAHGITLPAPAPAPASG